MPNRFRVFRSTQIRVMSPTYESWTREELISKIKELESKTTKISARTDVKPFDFSSHGVRKIALKFCYSGWDYNGLAFQSGPTPLPTVEDVLFKALAKTRLVDPEAGFDGCGWERCGRTDRGVSAAGQVVSVWVRSALGEALSEQEKLLEVQGSPGRHHLLKPKPPHPTEKPDLKDNLESTDAGSGASQGVQKSELRYVSILNRVLPETIRILAWSPVSPSFSARFACRHRHYKYFFTTDGLDIDLMRQGAARLLGEHDFRNLCKLDPTKQITNFKRTILRANISPVSEAENAVYVFDLMGTAFLYHQVRHIMAILFLVGTGLEEPSIVSALLNVDAENPQLEKQEDGPPLEVVDRKPEYQMADGLPLMLWDCAYHESDVQWHTDSDGLQSSYATVMAGTGSELYRQMQSIHSRSLIRTTLDAHFLSAAARFHPLPPLVFPLNQTGRTPSVKDDDQGVMPIPLGGGTFTRTAKYVPLLRRNRQDSVEITNERWRLGKGRRREEQRNNAVAEETGDE